MSGMPLDSDSALDKLLSESSTEHSCGCIDRVGYTLVCDHHTEAMDLIPEGRIAMVETWLQILRDIRLEEAQAIAKPKRGLASEGSPRTAQEFMRFVQARVKT